VGMVPSPDRAVPAAQVAPADRDRFLRLKNRTEISVAGRFATSTVAVAAWMFHYLQARMAAVDSGCSRGDGQCKCPLIEEVR